MASHRQPVRSCRSHGSETQLLELSDMIVSEIASSDRTKSSGESTAWIAAWSIIVLAMGVSLEIRRTVTEQLGPNTFTGHLGEFAAFEIYCIVIMTLSVAWMFRITCITLWRCGRNETTVKASVHRIGQYLIYSFAFFALGAGVLALFQCLALYNNHCKNSSQRLVDTAFCSLKIVFVTLQVLVVYMSRYYSLFHKTLPNGIALFHTIVTDIVLYIHTFVDSKAALRYASNSTSVSTVIPMPDQMTNTTEKCDESEDLQRLYDESRDYLYPFFFEFMLTAAALLAELWLEHEDTRHDEAVKPTVKPRNGKVSVSGSVIVGLLFVCNMIVMLMISHFFESGEDANRILNIQSVVVSVTTMFITLVGHVSLCRHESDSTGTGLDEVLLFLSLFGDVCRRILSIMASVYALSYGQFHSLQSSARMLAATEILWCVQMIIQATLISKALHKIPRHVEHCLGLFKHINVCQLSIVLLFINVAGYIGATFYAEPTNPGKGVYSYNTTVVMDEVRVNLYGSHGWSLIRVSTGPFTAFYHIHSVSTFYRIYRLHRHGSLKENCPEQSLPVLGD